MSHIAIRITVGVPSSSWEVPPQVDGQHRVLPPDHGYPNRDITAVWWENTTLTVNPFATLSLFSQTEDVSNRGRSSKLLKKAVTRETAIVVPRHTSRFDNCGLVGEHSVDRQPFCRLGLSIKKV
ncbi:hypothetical protein BHE74_00019391 [Ensete ventricosum]|nr:hypothetical protein GW17_00012913 [Ensete ventricosum]RWW72769.1 hypothetical protein BHE74_00019391 [Ensete ventricosum]